MSTVYSGNILVISHDIFGMNLRLCPSGVIAGGKRKLGLAHTFIAAHFVKLNVEHGLLPIFRVFEASSEHMTQKHTIIG